MSQETALDGTSNRIQELHELSFVMLEQKNNGADTVSMDEYEYLINHYITYIQDIRDAIIEHGSNYYCGTCGAESKGGE